ncbi:MAG: hypothetical protein ACRELY_09440 [Polyangiaceae bacterium]
MHAFRALIFVAITASFLLDAGQAFADDDAWSRPAQGIYGELDFTGMTEPFGAGNQLQRSCQDLGAANCSRAMPVGGGFMGHVGTMRGRYGVELMIGALGDFQLPSAQYDGVTHEPFGNPLLAKPAREETFIILRSGGMLAARGRYTIDGRRWRESIAAGIGLAYRYMALEREATSASGLEDRPYFPTGTHYFSPALSLDASLQYRTTPTLAFAFGLGIWIENAGGDTRSSADYGRQLAGNGQVAPIATPAYAMAYGPQVLFLPHIGLAFGP